jgi:hypothetical protein
MVNLIQGIKHLAYVPWRCSCEELHEFVVIFLLEPCDYTVGVDVAYVCCIKPGFCSQELNWLPDPRNTPWLPLMFAGASPEGSCFDIFPHRRRASDDISQYARSRSQLPNASAVWGSR